MEKIDRIKKNLLDLFLFRGIGIVYFESFFFVEKWNKKNERMAFFNICKIFGMKLNCVLEGKDGNSLFDLDVWEISVWDLLKAK